MALGAPWTPAPPRDEEIGTVQGLGREERLPPPVDAVRPGGLRLDGAGGRSAEASAAASEEGAVRSPLAVGRAPGDPGGGAVASGRGAKAAAGAARRPLLPCLLSAYSAHA